MALHKQSRTSLGAQLTKLIVGYIFCGFNHPDIFICQNKTWYIHCYLGPFLLSSVTKKKTNLLCNAFSGSMSNSCVALQGRTCRELYSATRSGFCKSVSKRHLTNLEKSQANFKNSNISPCTQWVSKRCWHQLYPQCRASNRHYGCFSQTSHSITQCQGTDCKLPANTTAMPAPPIITTKLTW